MIIHRVVEDPQCPMCGWPASVHASRGDGIDDPCPQPARMLCGSCDAMLPMACTCIDPPTGGNAA